MRLYVGITGHRFGVDDTWRAMAAHLDSIEGVRDARLVAVTSLAAGADQEFAQAVLDRGGDLLVVVPSMGYESTFESPEQVENYHRFLTLAGRGAKIVVLDSAEVEDDLVRDMTEVLTSFCARLYGRRGAANRARRAVEEVCQAPA